MQNHLLSHLYGLCEWKIQKKWLMGLPAGRRSLYLKQSVMGMWAESKLWCCIQEPTWCCRVNRAGLLFTRRPGLASTPAWRLCYRVSTHKVYTQTHGIRDRAKMSSRVLSSAQPGIINKRTDYGESALLVAVSKDRLRCVQVLLENGADPDITNYDKETPLYKGNTDSNFIHSLQIQIQIQICLLFGHEFVWCDFGVLFHYPCITHGPPL